MVMYSVGILGVLLVILFKFMVKEFVRMVFLLSIDDVNKLSVKLFFKMLLKILMWWGMVLGIFFGLFGNYVILIWVIDYYVCVFVGLDII